jgi:hypothetical protein
MSKLQPEGRISINVKKATINAVEGYAHDTPILWKDPHKRKEKLHLTNLLEGSGKK